MRISDWSSDVCSSDLPALELTEVDEDAAIGRFAPKAAFRPCAVLDFVPYGILTVAGDGGKAFNQYPLAWSAHDFSFLRCATGDGSAMRNGQEIVTPGRLSENSLGRAWAYRWR